MIYRLLQAGNRTGLADTTQFHENDRQSTIRFSPRGGRWLLDSTGPILEALTLVPGG